MISSTVRSHSAYMMSAIYGTMYPSRQINSLRRRYILLHRSTTNLKRTRQYSRQYGRGLMRDRTILFDYSEEKCRCKRATFLQMYLLFNTVPSNRGSVQDDGHRDVGIHLSPASSRTTDISRQCTQGRCHPHAFERRRRKRSRKDKRVQDKSQIFQCSAHGNHYH